MITPHSTTEEFEARDHWINGLGLSGPESGTGPVRFRYGDADAAPAGAGWRPIPTGTADRRYRHEASGLELDLELRVHEDIAAVEWLPWLRNTGSSPTPQISDWQSLDALLPLPPGPAAVHYNAGSYGTIDDFAPRYAAVAPGESVRLTPGGGRSSSEVLPYFSVGRDGTGIALAIGWSGEWALEIQGTASATRARVGLAHTDFYLRPGESVRGPSVAVVFWSGAPQRAGNLMRRFLLAHHTPVDADGGPVVPVLSCGTWGATPESVHRAVVDQITREKIPFERYWIDAGWFGDGQGEWFNNVGSWDPDPAPWPTGLRPISDQVHESGMDLLLWFEPERVTRGSTWHRTHPEWLLHVAPDQVIEWVPDRSDPRWTWHESRRTELEGGEGLFDLGNDEARSFLIDELSRRIGEWHVDAYRNDFNFSPLPFWRHADEPGRAGWTELNYVAGLYEVFDELRRRHPGLTIDNCASGGRRLDFELLSRANVLSRSDYVHDPIGHQCHTYGLSTWVPTAAALPDTGYSSYSLRSAMTHGMSLSWATDFNRPESGVMDLDFAQLRADLAELLEVRDAFLGDYYPLTPYSTSPNAWLGYQFHRPEHDEGIALLFRRSPSAASTHRIALRGLHPESRYRLVGAAGESEHRSGAELADGFDIGVADAPGALLLRYRAETPRPASEPA